MFTKFFSMIAIAALFIGGIAACNNDNVPSAQTTMFEQTEAMAIASDDEMTDEVNEDDAPGSFARIAAIDTANQVKVQLRVTGSCSASGSAGFKYVEGSSTTPVLSATATTSALGFKSFSVQRAKWNTPVLKTFDKTKNYAIYAKVPGVKKIPAVAATPTSVSVAAIPAIPVTYKYVLSLPANPAAEKKMNAAGTKRTGRPITTSITTLSCPN